MVSIQFGHKRESNDSCMPSDSTSSPASELANSQKNVERWAGSVHKNACDKLGVLKATVANFSVFISTKKIITERNHS